MMKTTKVKTVLEETKEMLDGYVADYNKAILEKNLSAKNEAETNIRGALKTYKSQKLDSVLYNLKQQENPMMSAVRMLTYTALRAKIVREDGKEVGIELVEQDIRIDLVKAAEYFGASTVWRYKVEKLGLLLALRAAKEMGIPAVELKAMSKDYRLHDLARKEEMGETPTSNTQIVKMIQTILDEVLPDAGKANSHDASYLWMAATRAGREAKTLKVCDARLAHNLFADVANRIVTNGRYSVDYRKVRKSSEQDAPAHAPVVVDDELAAAMPELPADGEEKTEGAA